MKKNGYFDGLHQKIVIKERKFMENLYNFAKRKFRN